jgi:glycosidase
LSSFRQTHTAITCGDTYNLPVSEPGVMAYLRYDSTSTVLVVLNLSAHHHKIKLAHEKINGNFINAFSGFSFPFTGEVPFELMPGDYFVYARVHS